MSVVNLCVVNFTMRYFSLILLIVLFGSCNLKNSNLKSGFNSIISDTANFKWTQNKTTILNLSQINKGVDSFELRLWCSMAITDLKFVTILKFSNSNWQLTETRYWIDNINRYPNDDLMILDSSFTKKLVPRISFADIIDSINYFCLGVIPTQNKISGFIDRTADGISYTLEVASKNCYKILSYNNPKYYMDDNHKRINSVLKFFQRNLGLFVLE